MLIDGVSHHSFTGEGIAALADLLPTRLANEGRPAGGTPSTSATQPGGSTVSAISDGRTA